MRRFLMVLLCVWAATASAQLNDTEVWIGKLETKAGALIVSDLRNISQHPGYDNQPVFFPDGQHLAFTTEEGELDDTGRGVHAVLYDLVSGDSTSLAGAIGFSPTPTADGKALMTLREGRVWLHDASGKATVSLTETTDVGYYARFDDRTWALFMNDKQRRVVLYDAKTKALDTMSIGANTPLYFVPGERAVTFVGEEPFPRPEGDAAKDAPPRTLYLRKLDVKKRTVTTLARIPFPTGGHHVWTSRRTILIASGPMIYEWNPARPEEWKPVYQSENPDLRGITRIALSPRGDSIALVSPPRDDTVIRDSRAASNRALASHKSAEFIRLFSREAVVTSASGKVRQGTEAIQKAIEEQWKGTPDLVYTRTPETIEISRSDAAASERGTWIGRGTASGSPFEKRGQYMTVWRKEIGDNGVASWTIASEMFVPLDCTGAGCK